MIAVHEACAGARFDALAGRFKPTVAADDPRLVAVARRLLPLEGRRVLDLGCGKGRFGRALVARGARVVGLDLSAAMLRSAEGLERVRGSARRLPFDSGAFDRVVAVEVFEHLPPAAWDRTLAEIRRVLAPGGVLAIVDKNAAACDPNRPWLPGVVVKWIDERRGLFMYQPGDPARERWFWPRAFTRRLSRRFIHARAEYLITGEEAGRFPFERFPGTRRFVLWSAVRPGGGS